MLLVFYLLVLGSLGVIAYQDFRHRLISVIPLAVVAVTILIDQFFKRDWMNILLEYGMNVFVLLTLLGGLYLYFVRFRGKKKFFDEILGWGDVVFLFVMALMFSPFNFVLTLNVGLLLTLIFALSLQYLGKSTWKLIPLAGTLSVYNMIILIAEAGLGTSWRYDDSIILNLIYH